MLVSILGELLISEDVQATAYSFGIQLQRPQKECRYISYIFRYSFARYTVKTDRLKQPISKGYNQ